MVMNEARVSPPCELVPCVRCVPAVPPVSFYRNFKNTGGSRTDTHEPHEPPQNQPLPPTHAPGWVFLPYCTRVHSELYPVVLEAPVLRGPESVRALC